MDQIPSSEKVIFKPLFEKNYRELMGAEYDKFIKFSMSYLNKTIRVNTLKISVNDFKKRFEKDFDLNPVPWSKEAFWMSRKDKTRYDLGNLLEHHLGYFYLQEAASMLPPIALLEGETIKPNALALDCCAAPGSKTTQLAAMLNNKGLIIANDVQTSRLHALRLNLQRMGVQNAVITSFDAVKAKNIGEIYDYIMVDAPCSGTGTIRRSFKTLEMYSEGLVTKLSKTQKKLLFAAYEALKPGGIMTYSTCTLEPLENEYVVSELLKNYADAEIIPFKLNIKRTPAVLNWQNIEMNPAVKDCLRINPQDNNTEGFFVAKIKKNK